MYDPPDSVADLGSHKSVLPRALFLLGLPLAWFFIQLLKNHTQPLLVHVGLLAIFAFAGLFAANQTINLNDRGIKPQEDWGLHPTFTDPKRFISKYKIGLKLGKPQSWTGLATIVLYLALTAVSFLAFSSGSLQTKLAETAKYAAEDVGFLLAISLAPLYEELFFRGGLLTWLDDSLARNLGTAQAKWSAFWAVYLCALIFWMFHLPASGKAWSYALSQGALPLGPGPFFLGLVCGGIALKDKSIWAAVVLHALCNACGGIWRDVITNESVLRLFYSLE